MLDFIMSRRSILVLVVLAFLVMLAVLLLWKIVRGELAERSAATTMRVDGAGARGAVTFAA
jgi:hypothetical protein